MRPGVEVTELASGLRVASEFRPDVHGVAFGTWIRVGSRDEAEPVAGVSHLIEHLLFRGTERHDALSIAESFDRFGAKLHASTSQEETTIYTRVLSEHLPKAIDIVGSMVAKPEFKFKDIQLERKVVLEELALDEDMPDVQVGDVLRSLLFPDQAVGRPIAGFVQTVEGLDEAAIRSHHAVNYNANQVVVAAAGAIDHAELLTLVEQSFDGLHPGGVSQRVNAVASPGGESFLERDTEQTHIAIGGVGIGRQDERRFALALLDQILGGGASSRLWQQIREQRGLVYDVYSCVSYLEETGQIGLALGTRTESLSEALAVASAEISSLAAGQFHSGEVERARDSLKARLLLDMDSTYARMIWLGDSLVSNLPLMTDLEVARRIDLVSETDVQALVVELFAPVGLSVAGIGPDQDAFAAAVEVFRQPVGGGA